MKPLKEQSLEINPSFDNPIELFNLTLKVYMAIAALPRLNRYENIPDIEHQRAQQLLEELSANVNQDQSLTADQKSKRTIEIAEKINPMIANRKFINEPQFTTVNLRRKFSLWDAFMNGAIVGTISGIVSALFGITFPIIFAVMAGLLIAHKVNILNLITCQKHEDFEVANLYVS